MADNLKKAHEALARLAEELDEMNSAYPATREFLRQRGLTRVSQLDETGRQELTEHLQRLLQQLTG